MTATNPNLVQETTTISAFKSAAQARTAVAALRDADFSPKRIGVLSKDDDGETNLKSFKELEGNHAGKGAAIGAAAGAGTGVLWALGIAAGLLPAIGPVVAGGLLGAVAASGAAGAAVAGVVGALTGLGISDEDAAYYEDELRKGSTIVAVKCENPKELARARAILDTNQAYNRPNPKGAAYVQNAPRGI